MREFGYAEVRARGHSALLRRHRGPPQRRGPRPARRLDEPRRQGHRAAAGVQGDRAATRPCPIAGDGRRVAPLLRACSSTPRSRTRSRAPPSSRRFAHEICGCGQDWNMPDYVAEARGADPRAGRDRGGDPRALRRRRLVGRGGADPPGDRRPAHLRVRRPRPAAPERGRAGDGHLRPQPRRARGPRRRRRRDVLRRSQGVTDPEQKRRVIGRLFVDVFQREAVKLRDDGARALAGAGHDLPRRDRVGGRQDQEGAHDQVAPQRRRPAGVRCT